MERGVRVVTQKKTQKKLKNTEKKLKKKLQKKSTTKNLADADGFAEATAGEGREDCDARPPPTRLSSCWRGRSLLTLVGLF